MNTKQNNINICLFKLSDKDQAAVERVIQFSTSQGKHYVLWGEIEGADIVIASDTQDLVDLPAIVIQVGDQAEESDRLVLHPPLLVSRVMRVIDKAASMLASSAVVKEVDQREVQSAVAEENIRPKDEAKIIDKAISSKIVERKVEKSNAQDAAAADEETKTVQVSKTNTWDGATEKTETIKALKSKGKARHAEEIKADHRLEAEEKSAQSLESKPKADDASGKFIALVVDDSAAIRKQLELELRIAKIEADFAETGEEALEKSVNKNYDLIFLDIVMPGIDGYEVCKQMRLRESMKKTPIVMLSGKTSPLDEVQGVIAGASTYLTKPVKHEMFQKTLNRLSTWLSDYSS